MYKNRCLVWGISLFWFASMPSLFGQIPSNEEFEGSQTLWEMRDVYQRYFTTAFPDTEIKRPGKKQFQRFYDFWEKRVDSEGRFPRADILATERARIDNFNRQRKAETTLKVASNPEWKSLGPNTVPTGGGGAGRLNCVELSRTDENLIWVGSASGGAWKSTDGGTSWTSTTDKLPTLGVNDIALDQKNHNIVYLATGDDWGKSTYSVGILRSNDAGKTWQQTGLSWQTNQQVTVSRLLISPTSSNTLVAATSAGIFKSTDAGAVWVKKQDGNFRDLEYHDETAAVMFTCTNSQLFRSQDGGETWSRLTNIQGLSSQSRKMCIAVSEINYNVYIVATNNSSGFGGLFRSTNGGDSWGIQSTTPNILSSSASGAGSGGQGWYDLALGVSTAVDQHIMVGGINVWRSLNSGSSWSLSGNWVGSGSKYVHADIHDIDYSAATGHVYAACDGGLFKSTDNGQNWTDISGNLSIHQIYRSSFSPTESGLYLSGAQDNGSSRLRQNRWSRVLGGDGMDNHIDPTNSQFMYCAIQNGVLRRSEDGGASFQRMIDGIDGNGSPGITGESGRWVTPFLLDPKTPSTLYAGYQNVWKSTDRGRNWSKTSLLPNTNSTLHTMAISESNPQILYVANSAGLYTTADAGGMWVQLPLIFNASQITDIAVHPTDPKRLWATVSGYSGKNAFYSSNGGTVWTDISAGLPKIPANTVVFQRNSNDRILVGTDVGIYYRDPSTTVFVDYNEGLPNVIVNDLDINYTNSTLVAGTYGRGLWEGKLPNCPTGSLTLSAKGVTELCEGDSVILEAQSGFVNYEWNNGAKTRTIVVKQTGSYAVTGYDKDGCAYSAEPIDVNVYEKRDVRITTTTGNIVCAVGDSARLSASLGFSEYQWSNGMSGRVVFVTSPGKYWVKTIFQGTCSSISDTVTAVFPPIPTFIEDNGVFTSSEAQSYQWRVDGKDVAGATQRTFTPTVVQKQGKITVLATYSDGCQAESRNFVSNAEDQMENENDWAAIAPNPTDGTMHLTIKCGWSSGLSQIEMIDVSGRSILNRELEFSSNGGVQTISLNTSDFAKGVYFLRVMSCGVEKVLRVIVQ